jgi:hypothetical protein
MYTKRVFGYRYPIKTGAVYQDENAALQAFKRDLESGAMKMFGPFTNGTISINEKPDSNHKLFMQTLDARNFKPVSQLETDERPSEMSLKCDTLPSYNQAKKSGRIVMNPYTMVKTKRKRTWGKLSIETGKGVCQSYSRCYGSLKWRSHTNGWYSAQVEQVWLHEGAYVTGTEIVLPKIAPKDELDPSLYNTDLFTKVSVEILAKASSADFDAATNIAEGKETVEMLRTVIPELFKYYRKLRKVWVQIPAELLNPNRARRRWLRARNRAKKLIYENGSAASNYHLLYRYGFLPLAMSVEDAIKALKRTNASYITERTGDSAKLNQLYPPHETALPVYYDVSYSNKTTGVWKGKGVDMQTKQVSLFLPVTAYELVPFSFVAEWFLNVGDFLQSLRPVPAQEQNSCVSVLEKTGVRGFVLFEQASETITVTDRIPYHEILKWEEYKLPISREISCFAMSNDHFKRGHPKRGLVINNGLNFIRSVDAVALLWQLQARKLFK